MFSNLVTVFSFIRLLLLIAFSANVVLCGDIVKYLPGYDGELPFTLETGYTSVGDVEFFYYFVHSEYKPAVDPILLYINGGPGCTALNGFFYQIGPLKFDWNNYGGGLPKLLLEDASWSKTVNILFLDAPVGTGFSYAKTAEAWNSTDLSATNQIYEFTKNWLANHTDFELNPLYLGSDSYAGLYVPMLAEKILNGNRAGLKPFVNLKGFSIGCPHTDMDVQENAVVPLARNLGLISEEMYQAANQSCNGTYYDYDATNTECVAALDAIDQCTKMLSTSNVLEPNCANLSPKDKEIRAAERSIRVLQENLPKAKQRVGEFFCHTAQYLMLDIWPNFQEVREALHVRPETVPEFHRCNDTMSYTFDVLNVLSFHKNLTRTSLQGLAFSGDHDMVIPHNGVEKWIKSLNLTILDDWRPWFTDGQIAGYTRKYDVSRFSEIYYGYRLTYATIKGAGHSPPEYERKKCFEMFHRWIRHYPL